MSRESFVTSDDILRLRALGAQLLVVVQAVGEDAGRRAQAHTTARKLLEHGIPWEVVTAATGIVEEDLGEA
jgi:hypothetical protein